MGKSLFELKKELAELKSKRENREEIEKIGRERKELAREIRREKYSGVIRAGQALSRGAQRFGRGVSSFGQSVSAVASSARQDVRRARRIERPKARYSYVPVKRVKRKMRVKKSRPKRFVERVSNEKYYDPIAPTQRWF